MRVHELTGYRNNPLNQMMAGSKNPAEFVEQLKSKGYEFKKMGEGVYAQVLMRPGDPYVIKIFKNDPGYEQFLKYIMKFKNNPHVPKLRGKVMNLANGFKVVRLEKLDPLTPGDKNDLYVWRIINAVLDYNDEEFVERLKAAYPEILPVVQELKKYSTYERDFGINNMMFRGKTPVITDPLVFD